MAYFFALNIIRSLFAFGRIEQGMCLDSVPVLESLLFRITLIDTSTLGVPDIIQGSIGGRSNTFLDICAGGRSIQQGWQVISKREWERDREDSSCDKELHVDDRIQVV